MPFEAAALARRVVAPGRCPVPVVERDLAGGAVIPVGEAAFLAGRAAFPMGSCELGNPVPTEAAALARRIVAPGWCPVPEVGVCLAGRAVIPAG